MNSPNLEPAVLDPAACVQALGARDPRFDGLFFVGITSTGIYCRPICPARVSIANHRRFFDTAAAAEMAGYRPCLRCRPELAPGRARVDAVPRLAERAAQRIEAGALNGQGVGALAEELGVSERHLRRALERELGVSPSELARTHRLLLAKRLLADTSLPVTRIAFASGFQSLRRFNATFQERYHMSPSAMRRPGAGTRTRISPAAGPDMVRLTLAYRPPLAWAPLLDHLRQERLDGLEVVEGGRYGRTLRIGDHAGVVLLAHAAGRNQVEAEVSSTLLPVLMPLLARLRHLLDLDAQPSVVDRHLSEGGLERLVRLRPGLRIPGAVDGFEVAVRTVLEEAGKIAGDPDLGRRALQALGEPARTGIPGLTWYFPAASGMARIEPGRLVESGVPAPLAGTLRALAAQVASGRIRLEPQHDPLTAFRALVGLDGILPRWASTIVTRALYWPDAFDPSDPLLLRAAGLSSSEVLGRRAERWRPWRTYAALHLRLSLDREPGVHG